MNLYAGELRSRSNDNPTNFEGPSAPLQIGCDLSPLVEFPHRDPRVVSIYKALPNYSSLQQTMKMIEKRIALSHWLALSLFCLTTALFNPARGDDRLIGIWIVNEGSQVTELLFRSDGRYQLDTKSTEPDFDFSSTDRGYYELGGDLLTLTPYDFLGNPNHITYRIQIDGNALTLTRTDIEITTIYQYRIGSREEVLSRQKAPRVLIGEWTRTITFAGKSQYTFRPGGYYILKNSSEGDQFPPEFIRGRYQVDESILRIQPYSGLEASYEIDFFGNTLTLIENQEFLGRSTSFENIPNSEAAVRAKSAEAEAFLSRENWQVGAWEIREEFRNIDLTIRPDGHYIAVQNDESFKGIVRGRYNLEARRINLMPFPGQGIYSQNNGEFGKVERTRELDYYDGQLQFIDLGAISQSVTLGRKAPGSDEGIVEKVRLAKAEQAKPGWQVGVWQVQDPEGWMEFTFRPDNRYIAKSGFTGAATAVERGRYRLRDGKITLAPYSGNGTHRGFETDFYDGDLFLVGDVRRMVIARKVTGSEAEVIEKTTNPVALKGERGSLLGLWTANLPGYSGELVFRPDGQFRLNTCNGTLAQNYGLYSVDMAARTLVWDSRFTPVQTLSLDFYGNTLTMFGGLGSPSTYTVNLGTVDTAIAASLAADAAESQVDAQWLLRIPMAPKDPNSAQVPAPGLPADPFPGRTFNGANAFENYQLYRRLIAGFVYFNEIGSIKSVAVVNTREWHFFPNGRVLVRFKNYHPGPFYPNTIEDVTAYWGAYRIDPKPAEQDIFHLYADNSLHIEMDSGEQAEMTLEDGRRHLFWGKDYQILSEWAAEQKAIVCQPVPNGDASLLNTGIALSTTISPDPTEDAPQSVITIARPHGGNITVSGTNALAGTLVIEGAASLGSPTVWQTLQTNSAPAGAFSFILPHSTNGVAYFRVRRQ